MYVYIDIKRIFGRTVCRYIHIYVYGILQLLQRTLVRRFSDNYNTSCLGRYRPKMLAEQFVFASHTMHRMCFLYYELEYFLTLA